MRCKCRYCQTNLDTKNAYCQTINKQKAYFCNNEHYDLFLEKQNQKKIQKEAEIKERKRKQEEKAAEIEKRKQIKDKAYYLICEIIGRKEIVNTILWKEWALWNKVASNENIGSYLEENKSYLCELVSKIENNEFLRIKYISAILKNKLGDYRPDTIVNEMEKTKTQVDATFYEPIQTNNNKRRSLEDLEDEF